MKVMTPLDMCIAFIYSWPYILLFNIATACVEIVIEQQKVKKIKTVYKRKINLTINEADKLINEIDTTYRGFLASGRVRIKSEYRKREVFKKLGSFNQKLTEFKKDHRGQQVNHSRDCEDFNRKRYLNKVRS